MINPNRLLIALLVGLTVLQLGFGVAMSTSSYGMWILPFIIPLILALSGRGGKFIYWIALAISWVMAALMLLLILDFYSYFKSEAPYDSGQPFGYAGGLAFFILSAIGIASHFTITRTHPLVTKSKLDYELNSLFISLMQGLLFGFGANVVLLVLCVEGDWTFSELIWIYWIESVMISGFTTWTITKLDQFDAEDSGLIGRTVDQQKKDLVDNQIRGMGVLYCAYLAVILFLVGIPDIANPAYLPVLFAAYVASHYYAAKQRQRALRNRRPRLKSMLRLDVWRIIPIHLAMMLALISFGDSHEAVAYLFVMIKALFDIIAEIVRYRHLRLMAIESPV